MAVRVVQTRHGSFLCQDTDQYVGQSLITYGEFSELEAQFLTQIARPGSIVVEAGSNIGALTVPIARSVGPKGRVWAFEPQRLIFQMLCGNLALNHIMNTRAVNAALGEREGKTKIPVLPYDGKFNFGDVRIDAEAGEEVDLQTIDGLLLPRVDLIKADVQGVEERVLRGAVATINRFKPVLYLENDQKEKSASLIAYIFSLGYQAWWHFPPLYNANNHAGHQQDIFGNVISINLMCVHPERNIKVAGSRKVSGPDDWWRPEK